MSANDSEQTPIFHISASQQLRNPFVQLLHEPEHKWWKLRMVELTQTEGTEPGFNKNTTCNRGLEGSTGEDVWIHPQPEPVATNHSPHVQSNQVHYSCILP